MVSASSRGRAIWSRLAASGMDNEHAARQIFQDMFQVVGKDSVDQAVSGVGRVDGQEVGVAALCILTDSMARLAGDGFFLDGDFSGGTEADHVVSVAYSLAVHLRFGL